MIRTHCVIIELKDDVLAISHVENIKGKHVETTKELTNFIDPN